MKIARLSGCKNFVGDREEFIFDVFVFGDLKFSQWRDLRMGVICVDLGAWVPILNSS